MNRSLLSGIASKVEIKTGAKGDFGTFSIEAREGQSTGNFAVVAFADADVAILRSLAPGARVLVEGKLANRSYERDGQKVWTTEVVASRVEVLDAPEIEFG